MSLLPSFVLLGADFAYALPTEQQNNKQGMGFVIFGQLCSRKFSWKLFVLAAAVLTTGVGMLTRRSAFCEGICA